MTLSGDATVYVLDTTIAFDGISDGRAGLLVDGGIVSCAEGETVSASRLTLRCTAVTSDAVTFEAARR